MMFLRIKSSSLRIIQLIFSFFLLQKKVYFEKRTHTSGLFCHSYSHEDSRILWSLVEQTVSREAEFQQFSDTKNYLWTSLMVLWLRFCTSDAGGLDWIILHATWCTPSAHSPKKLKSYLNLSTLPFMISVFQSIRKRIIVAS